MPLQHPKSSEKKIVVIIGGGFAGFNAAKSLANKKEVHVILIDRRNHHLFQPLLYQVATAGLNPSDIAVPIRARFAKAENVEIHMGAVEKINLSEKFISTDHGDLAYDYLIVATGAQHSYFANPEWEEYAPGLKTLEQATEIRRRILSAFEEAENEIDPVKQKSLLNFVVVGAGPTGVELAGAIADIARTVLVKDFNHINPASARVLLVEAGPKILASFNEKLSQRAYRDLQELGVEIRLSSRVEKIDENGVTVAGEFIPSRSVFWAAGVQASRMSFTPEVAKDRAGRVIVRKDFSIENHPDTFVIGDMAHFELSQNNLLPGLAPAAIQAGKFVANVVLQSINGQVRSSFKYLDKGQMATIGKRKAIAQYNSLRMTGVIAWLAWLFVHVLYLIGFKNRISVMAEWTWSYIFSKRGARLITSRDWKLQK
ncbi:NAD(P)/FAD-dependent oxidoreductase [Bdellovibrio sp. SKB1291214]|uniref:NAD(P)/FAD-dependent oxidoreductase n=1 Tax=Bdellovibrio sp. SKB1291214 TaxID=1732569 RepID=UPI000B518288|nr:NAD(P)/FAD-dependent oxidoreductase [Bdellovibrio sp. SKB1291214]UYL10776.1 NAD(P)/FAD-dependent oxidoreductase [Bdellovibrio sp. SKB1291214]